MSPWERRKRGGLYYTTSTKVDGRVVREYVGTGPFAEQMAEADTLFQRLREQEAPAQKKERERLEAITAPVEELCEDAEILARATLLAAGYHRHNRGEWRKSVKEIRTAKKNLPVGHPAPPDPEVMTIEEKNERQEIVKRLEDLTKRAEKGEKGAMTALRKPLDEHPDLARRLANFARLAEELWIKEICRSQEKSVTEEAMRRQFAAMREEVEGESSSPLERMLAERVVATWVQVQIFEGLCVGDLRNPTMSQADYRQRYLDRAHKRHLSAIRTLAQVRKLLRPGAL